MTEAPAVSPLMGILIAPAPPVGGGLAKGGIITEESTVWSPDGYITIEQYNNIKNIRAGAESPCGYLANGQPTSETPYGSLLRLYGYIFGSNLKPSDDNCGAIFRKIQCSTNPLHHPSFRHIHCTDPGCPICYPKFAKRISDAVTQRVQGYKTVYRNRKAYHLVLWPRNVESPYATLQAAMEDGKILAEIAGVEGGVMWFHPYRIKEEIKQLLRRYMRINNLNGKLGFWKLAHDDVLQLGGIENYITPGPHWHIIGFGWLRDLEEYMEVTEGLGYKKVRYLDHEREVYEVSYYLSTHACREATKSTVRYIGDMSYNKLAREHVETKIKDVLCNDCGSRLEEYDADTDGNIVHNGVPLSKIRDNITEKIKYYLYWKKGHPKPEMKDAWQCLISRFDNRNIN